MEEAIPQKRVLLELFSGSGSVGKAFRAHGWDVISLDSDPKAFEATIAKDILEFEVSELGGRTVDLVWASPPCTHYSVARTKAAGIWDMTASDVLVLKALSIAWALGCPIFVENPWTGKLKTRGWLEHLHLHRVDYCKYGMPYRKRTAIWTDTAWVPMRALCKYDCAASEGRRHTARAQQGSPGPHFTQKQLYVIPAALCDELALWATLWKDERDSPSTCAGGTYRRTRDKRGRYCGTEILPQTPH